MPITSPFQAKISCNSVGAKNFLKMKTPTLSLDSKSGIDKNKNKEPCSNEETQIGNRKASLDEDSNRTLDLFERYQPMIQPKFDNGKRNPSFLERSLLPGFRYSQSYTSSSLSDGGLKAPLTIFYRGEINVYNDVPIEKAQAIILLAGESSLSAPVFKNSPKTDEKKTVHDQQKLLSLCKSQTDLPIARKFSLKHFLEKRRHRITSKAPYPSPEKKHNEVADGCDHQTASNDHDKNEKLQSRPLVLSPFPSRLMNSFTLSK